MKNYLHSNIKRIFTTGLLCAAVTFEAGGVMVHKGNFDRQIRQSSEQYLTQLGFGPYNIPDRLRPDFHQRVADIRHTLTNRVDREYRSYASTIEIDQLVREKMSSFADNLQTVVHDYQVDAAVITALNYYMTSKNLNPNTLPSHAVSEYFNRTENIKNSLKILMRRDARTYVRTHEIEKAIRDEMEVLVRRINNSYRPLDSMDWWNFFFENAFNINANYNYNPAPQPVYEASSYAQVASADRPTYVAPAPVYDANKVYSHELESKVMQTVYNVLRANNVNPDKVPARVVSNYNDKTQKIIKRVRDRMANTGFNHVWKDEVETITMQELQSVIDQIQYKGELCTICQDNYGKGQRVGITSCNHVYHKDCIYQWLGSDAKKSCPLCRQGNIIVAKQEDVP